MVIPELQFGSAKEAFEVVRNYVEARAPGKGPTVFDLVKPKSSEMYSALKFLVENYFSGCNATAVRLGHGDRKLSELTGYENSLLMYWTSARAYEYSFAEF